MSKKYRLYCEICNWRRDIDGTETDLVEFATAPIPGGMPYFDSKQNKYTARKSITQPKKYKCQNCGRVVTVRKLPSSSEG